MHNFKYTLKTIFKSKALIFWTFAFPLIMATFFNMAFSDIEENERKRAPGSISFVPSVAGLIIAGEVIKDIIFEK